MMPVELAAAGHVRTITLNVPARLNALSWPLLDALRDAVAAVATDDNAHALVVTGAGRAFCAGADIETLFGDRRRPIDELAGDLRRIYASFLALHDLSIPTVAAVHGPAVGAGMNIAMACDVIVAGPDAVFTPSFANIGLHPGGGCTWLLGQRIGVANAVAALLSGDSIDAEHALRIGLAQELVHDPHTRATELAEQYAGREPAFMASIKAVTRAASDLTLAEATEVEITAQAPSLKSAAFEQFAARFVR